MAVSYFSRHVRYIPLDSVNAIFEGLSNFGDLLAAVVLVLDNAGWQKDRQDHEHLLELDNHFRYEADWRTRGPLWNRYHIRFWQGSGNQVLASAHKERMHLAFWHGHEVESFEDAKQVIEGVFKTAGWQVMKDSMQTAEPIDDPFANGRASVITHP